MSVLPLKDEALAKQLYHTDGWQWLNSFVEEQITLAKDEALQAPNMEELSRIRGLIEGLQIVVNRVVDLVED